LIAGLCGDSLLAPAVFDGAIDGELFPACAEQGLPRTLRPGDRVIRGGLHHAARWLRYAVMRGLDPTIRLGRRMVRRNATSCGRTRRA
jgi:hypothetical protein